MLWPISTGRAEVSLPMSRTMGIRFIFLIFFAFLASLVAVRLHGGFVYRKVLLLRTVSLFSFSGNGGPDLINMLWSSSTWNGRQLEWTSTWISTWLAVFMFNLHCSGSTSLEAASTATTTGACCFNCFLLLQLVQQMLLLLLLLWIIRIVYFFYFLI
jgi:hypothetical protein